MQPEMAFVLFMDLQPCFWL